MDLASVGAPGVRVSVVSLLALAHAVGPGPADVGVGAARVGHARVLGLGAEVAWELKFINCFVDLRLK